MSKNRRSAARQAKLDARKAAKKGKGYDAARQRANAGAKDPEALIASVCGPEDYDLFAAMTPEEASAEIHQRLLAKMASQGGL